MKMQQKICLYLGSVLLQTTAKLLWYFISVTIPVISGGIIFRDIRTIIHKTGQHAIGPDLPLISRSGLFVHPGLLETGDFHPFQEPGMALLCGTRNEIFFRESSCLPTSPSRTRIRTGLIWSSVPALPEPKNCLAQA